MCSASQPIQAYLFATELTLFQFWGDWLSAVADFWSLMFVMLAIFVAISYFALGWSSSTLAFVSARRALTAFSYPQCLPASTHKLTMIAYHPLLPRRVLQQHPLQVGSLFRCRRPLCRCSHRTAGHRSEPAPGTPRHQHGLCSHLVAQRGWLPGHCFLLRVEAHHRDALLLDALDYRRLLLPDPV